MTKPRSGRRSPGAATVVVRVVAFLVAALGILAIPAALLAASAGGMTVPTAMLAVAVAAALIATATLAARRVDPLRG